MIAVENTDAFLRPDAFDTDGDFARIRATLAHVEETVPAQRLKDMIFVAEGVVSANWRPINRLARLLFDRYMLDETGLARWFDIHPAARESHPVRPPHEEAAKALTAEKRIG